MARMTQVLGREACAVDDHLRVDGEVGHRCALPPMSAMFIDIVVVISRVIHRAPDWRRWTDLEVPSWAGACTMASEKMACAAGLTGSSKLRSM